MRFAAYFQGLQYRRSFAGLPGADYDLHEKPLFLHSIFYLFYKRPFVHNSASKLLNILYTLPFTNYTDKIVDYNSFS
jgi:hypothetical protein